MLSCLGYPYLSLLSLSEIHPTLPDVITPETVLYTYDIVCIGASECIINPRRMREGYGSRSVCKWVSECVCLLPR